MNLHKYRLQTEVLKVVERIGDPLISHIIDGVNVPDASDYQIIQTVGDLVRGGLLRMKDDDIDHDWAYLLTAQGREALRDV